MGILVIAFPNFCLNRVPLTLCRYRHLSAQRLRIYHATRMKKNGMNKQRLSMPFKNYSIFAAC